MIKSFPLLSLGFFFLVTHLYALNKYLLSIYHMPGSRLEAENIY